MAIGPPGLFIEDLRRRLVQPFPDVVASGKAWWFVCPAHMAERPKIVAFRTWLLDELARDKADGPPHLKLAGSA